MNHAIAINEFLMWQFNNTIKDIDDATMYQPGLGHGHLPTWILGHLVVAGEMGHKLLGGAVNHPEWVKLFGTGSSDTIAPNDFFARNKLCSIIAETYNGLRILAAAADSSILSKPHGFQPFEGSPIKSTGDFVALLLSNHFGFHLAQLSSCRRAAGHGPLF